MAEMRLRSGSVKSNWKTALASVAAFVIVMAVVYFGLAGPFGRLRISDNIKIPLGFLLLVSPLVALAVVFMKFNKREAFAFDGRKPGVRFDSERGVIEIPIGDKTRTISVKDALVHVGWSSEIGIRQSLKNFKGEMRTSCHTIYKGRLRIGSGSEVVQFWFLTSSAIKKTLVEQKTWPPLPEGAKPWHAQVYPEEFWKFVTALLKAGVKVSGFVPKSDNQE